MSANSNADGKIAARAPAISFAFGFVVIAVTLLAANIVQMLAGRWLESGDPTWRTVTLAVGVGFALVTAVLALRYRVHTVALFASLRFAAAVVAVLAVATAFGTLILQNQPAEIFEEHYGGLTTVLRALHAEDLFHSFWYMSLLVLTAISLTVDALLRIVDVARGKRDGWANVGFILTHVGIVVTLGGGLLSMLGGDKGMIHLVEGRRSAVYERQAKRSSEARTGQLPFEVRLDEFEVEHYPDEYSLYLYKILGDTGPHGRSNVEVIGALESKVGEHYRFAGGHELRVVEVIAPAPPPPETGADGKAPHVFSLDGGPEFVLQLGESSALGDGVTLEALRFLPHFNFDLKTREAISLSEAPENPAIEIVATRDADGETVYRGWLFAAHPGFTMDGHGGPLSKRLIYSYRGQGDAPHGARAGVPTLVLRLTKGGEEVMPAFRQTVGDSGRIPVEGGQYALVYSKKGDRIKQYHSTITLLRDGEELVSRQSMSVNHPVWRDGWALYQANYDPKNPRYSGIQVVKDPGLDIVYAGLILMGLGVIHILYLRRWRPGRKRQARAGEAGGAA